MKKTLISRLAEMVSEMDKQNVPKEGRVLRLTVKQTKELEEYLVNPTNLPDQILGCKVEVVDDKSPD